MSLDPPNPCPRPIAEHPATARMSTAPAYPTPEKAVLDVRLDSSGPVILADAAYPGWELSIDGKSAPIYRVNGVMRGAAVSSGSPHSDRPTLRVLQDSEGWPVPFPQLPTVVQSNAVVPLISLRINKVKSTPTVAAKSKSSGQPWVKLRPICRPASNRTTFASTQSVLTGLSIRSQIGTT